MCSLNWSYKLLKNANSVILRVIEVVFLFADVQVSNLVVCHSFQNYDLAAIVKGLHPLAKLVELGLVDC